MQKRKYGIRHTEGLTATTTKQRELVVPQGPAPTAAVLTLVTKAQAATARNSVPNAAGGIFSALKPRRPPILETFLGSVDAARAQAREIINEPRPAGYTRIVEGWHQLPDGRIQFSIRTLLR